jgi:hypothetical protein
MINRQEMANRSRNQMSKLLLHRDIFTVNCRKLLLLQYCQAIVITAPDKFEGEV